MQLSYITKSNVNSVIKFPAMSVKDKKNSTKKINANELEKL